MASDDILPEKFFSMIKKTQFLSFKKKTQVLWEA